MKYLLCFLLVFFTSTCLSQAQTTDNAKQKTQTVKTDSLALNSTEAAAELEDDTWLLYFALVAMGAIITCVAAGIIVTGATLFLLFALVSAGIVGASFLVGVYTRSLTKGFKTFFILSATAIGAVCGGVTLFLVNLYSNWYVYDYTVLTGVVLGMITGLAGGMVSFYFLQRLAAYLKTKLSV